MSPAIESPNSAATTLSRRTFTLAALVVLLMVATSAYVFGKHQGQQATWHTVTFDLAGVAADEDSSHRLVSVESDGWTYGIEDNVAWIDRAGTYHDGGWPACLEPRRPGFSTSNHEKVTLRFASVVADTGNLTWRPVVMVDCQAA